MKKIRLTCKQFILRAVAVHGNKYDYSHVVYVNTLTKVIITCPTHGDFLQRPNAHTSQRQGCPACAKGQASLVRSLTTNQFIERAIQVHGDKYDYTYLSYVNATTKVHINCGVHGIFAQRPHDHMNGVGCPSCGQINRATSNTHATPHFISAAQLIHQDRYQYDAVEYTGLHNGVAIMCSHHGLFYQTPNTHVHCSSGCPKCAHTVSNKEQAWLTQCGIPDNEACRQVILHVGNSWVKVDGYDPETGTVYEFLGDYWHGNPQIHQSEAINSVTKTTFGQLLSRTIARFDVIAQAGYKIIFIWESDFDTCNS